MGVDVYEWRLQTSSARVPRPGRGRHWQCQVQRIFLGLGSDDLMKQKGMSHDTWRVSGYFPIRIPKTFIAVTEVSSVSELDHSIWKIDLKIFYYYPKMENLDLYV